MRNLITLLFISLLSVTAQAQEAIFKQNSTNLAYFNPANACKSDKVSFEFLYLNDWPELGDAFNSTLINANVRLPKKWNLDFNFFNDQQGEFRSKNELYFGFGKKIEFSGFSVDLGFSSKYESIQHVIDENLIKQGAIKGPESIANIGFNAGLNLGYAFNSHADSVHYYKVELGVSALNFLEPDNALINSGSSPSLINFVSSQKVQYNFALKNKVLKTQLHSLVIYNRLSTYYSGGIQNELLLGNLALQSLLLDLNIVNDGGIGLGIGANVYGVKVKLSKGIPLLNVSNRITNEYYQLGISYSIK